MRYALLIAMREFSENVQTKGFWIGIFLFPLILMVAIKVPQFLEERATPTRWFTLLDQSGELSKVVDAGLDRSHQWRVFEAAGKYVKKHTKPEYASKQIVDLNLEDTPASVLDVIRDMQDQEDQRFDAFMASGGATVFIEMMEDSGVLEAERPEFEPPRQRFARIEPPQWLHAGLQGEQLDELIKEHLVDGWELESGDELFAVVVIPKDLLAPKKTGLAGLFGGASAEVDYWSTNQADMALREAISRSLDGELHRRRYAAAGFDEGIVSSIQSERVSVKSLDPSKEAGEEEVSLADRIRQYAPVGFVYLLWIALMSVVQMLLNNTIEEKSNRIIEVLLSSVTAGELMAGKLIGIAGVGMTMLLAWVGSLLAILHWQAGPEAEFATKLLEVVQESGLLLIFLGYFMMAYLLYSGIFLAIGSMCNTIKEAQNFMGPVMILMMVPLLTMMFIPKDPNGTLATVLSWIPIYTPFVMMNRAAADPPMFDLVGTTILGAVSIVVVIWLAGKIFRYAILRTGQPPRLLEIFRWLRS